MRTPSNWCASVVTVLAVAVVNLGFASVAQAGIVGTSAIVSTARDSDLSSIRTQLERSDVRAQMEKMGVDATRVDQRLAALSDSELHDLAKQMQNGPAGGDVLVLLGAVFVVLIVLEIVGVIDIFKRR